MRFRWSILILAAILGLALLLAAPRTAAACTYVPMSFDHAVREATAVARVRLVDVSTAPAGPNEFRRVETFAVLQVLRGRLPATLILDPPDASPCNDAVSFWLPEGERELVLAYGVPVDGHRIHPVWARSPESGVGSSVGLPYGATTLADVEAAVQRVGAIPAVAAPPAGLPDILLPFTTMPVVAITAALLLIAGFGRRRTLGLQWREP